MDAIETGKKFIAESVAPVVEYKGGTDAEKIKNWQDHIKNFDNFPKAQDDARQAAKKAQPGAKFYKTDDKPKKEGMGSIARALMQDMAVDEEGDPAWYGPGGANLMTGQPVAPGTGNPIADIKAWNRDRLNQRAADRGAAATQAAANANPEVYGYGGAPESPQGTTPQPQSSNPAAQAAAAGTPEMNIGQGATPAQAPAAGGSEMDTPAPAGITPASQAKPAAGGSEMDTPAPAGMTPASQAKPAAQTAPAAPAKTGGMSKAVSDLAAANNITNPNMIKVGQQLKMPDGSTYVVKPGDTLGKIAGGGKQAAASPAQSGKQAAASPAQSGKQAAASPQPDPMNSPDANLAGSGNSRSLPSELDTADKNKDYWVKGTRYTYKTGLVDPQGKLAGQWQANHKPGEWGWNWNQKASQDAYTGVDQGSQYKKTATAEAQGRNDMTESDNEILALIRGVKF